jgi:hypothetical protein
VIHSVGLGLAVIGSVSFPLPVLPVFYIPQGHSAPLHSGIAVRLQCLLSHLLDAAHYTVTYAQLTMGWAAPTLNELLFLGKHPFGLLKVYPRLVAVLFEQVEQVVAIDQHQGFALCKLVRIRAIV